MIDSEEQAREFCKRICGMEKTAMGKLEQFVSLLRVANLEQNLVATSSLDDVWQRHIADSLQLLDLVPRETTNCLDLGSGAGFPGLALAIAQPNISIKLVESRKRRVSWLNDAIEHLGLTNCRVEGSRLETLRTMPVEAITARAFAPLDRLLRVAGRFSAHSTVWLLPKGRSGVQELAEQPLAVRSMFHVEQSKTDPAATILVGKGKIGQK
ncbi:16S rRNA (guanine(527)-N(7))-methyltransferase RsmG [Erythrobacter arachoides]|uniref:Ribosomal RNA small subunit methyltransferase G n=1 Tax=Aurantiacibacter arachoides TaxID=1850444 RepID=A0A845A4P9_9SPHN|nr:16S rRNA (guanine(527)-N(7))-methyltransferase RsmG [Aurantiacibacter arachoides]MXO94650.1 16S rRNA (guanine(527)-N(7))-methyltransferase RsmG [Aurantiacibacter arachoides]